VAITTDRQGPKRGPPERHRATVVEQRRAAMFTSTSEGVMNGRARNPLRGGLLSV